MKMNKIVGVVLLLAGWSAGAATCRPELPVSTPTERFEAGDKTVTDRKTSLEWMRCAVGQRWSGSMCTGEPQVLPWKEAAAVVSRLNRESFAGRNDWRLPMLPELASIVERKCFNPRMNEAVFPGAPSQVFWSGMEKPDAAGYAYALDFGRGWAQPMSTEFRGALRLVRGGPWWKPPAALLPK